MKTNVFLKRKETWPPRKYTPLQRAPSLLAFNCCIKPLLGSFNEVHNRRGGSVAHYASLPFMFRF